MALMRVITVTPSNLRPHSMASVMLDPQKREVLVCVRKTKQFMQVVIVTLNNPVFDNSTNELKYDITFVPNVHHKSSTAEFYKRHANATGSPKVGSAHRAPEGALEVALLHTRRALCSNSLWTVQLLSPLA